MLEQFEHGLGRLPSEDERDTNFPMSSVLRAEPERNYRYWWPSGWWGDQGATPHCVAYAWLHYLEDGPVTHAPRLAGMGPVVEPLRVYQDAQQVDEWTGTDYDGTSVRAGAKVLQRLGYIGEYRWAWDVDTVVRAILTETPVVVGTWWYDSMFYTNDEGFVKVDGNRMGGHAYLLNGVNLRRGIVRAKNSWGRGWGMEGHFYMDLADLSRLINESGEACIATEIVPST